MNILCVVTVAALLAAGAVAEEHSCDVVVYGATAGGAVAAIAAANSGAEVILVEPGRYVGGMVTGGLGATDFGKKDVIGGMAREFFVRLGRHYGEPVSWFFEPHVATEAFRAWLDEAGVKVHFGQAVKRVAKEGARIRAFETVQGNRYTARVFIDGGYEGDLMARAGVSYTWGREGSEQYGESLAGRLAECKYHQFGVKVSPYDEKGGLLPLVYGGEPGKPGEGDRKVQAYNFRLCLSDLKENQVPFPKPGNYDPNRYELLRRYLAARPEIKLAECLNIKSMPNHKTDINNNGPISTDYIGGSWEYPEADYARRAEIVEEHKQYVLGLLYFLANDASVPRPLQEEVNGWGLAKDEFVDNGHWPHQMYVREARRMVGAFVMTEADAREQTTKPDSIGMGSYNIDSHHVQRIPTEDGGVINEGDMQIKVSPYEIPYRVLTPKVEECDNLLVPVCVSASHVAYSTLRMEPQYMIMGQAAGTAAAMAVRADRAVQEVDTDALRTQLRAGAAVLSMADIAAGDRL